MDNSSSNAFASTKSAVSNPSVKPVVDVGEHRTALVAASSILQHPREADRARTVSVSQFVPSMSYLHAQIEFNRGT